MTTEDRVRELLQDPRWSLPVWPDVQARARRAARRQRLTAASVGAAVAAFVTTAAVIPVVLLGRLSPGGADAASGGVPVAARSRPRRWGRRALTRPLSGRGQGGGAEGHDHAVPRPGRAAGVGPRVAAGR